MSEFSSTEAAFEGLRLSRERPRAVLWWWAAYILAAVIQFILAIQPPFRHLSDQLTQLQSESVALQQNANDAIAAQHFLATLGQVIGPMLLFAVVVLLMQMVLSTAVLRAVLRPADKAAGYLRLGMDEVRQLGLAMVVLASILLYAFVVSLVSSLVIGIVTGLSGGRLPAAPLGALAVAAIWVSFLYPAVRLSLAPAMTLADGRISFLRAWALTKDRFWSLFAAYALAAVVGFAIWAAIATIFAILIVVMTGQLQPPEPQGAVGLFTPASIAALLVKGLLGALVGAVATAPMASAFRQITGRVGAPAPSAPVSSVGSPWGQA